MTIEEDLVSWEVQASMKSAYGGSLSLTNQDSNYDETLLQTPISIELTCAATVVDVSGTVGAFTGNKTWLNGLVASVDPLEGISERMIQLSVKSFFARLAARPVFTEKDIGTVSGALQRIAKVHGGIPDAYDTFVVNTREICGPVQGSSILDEMRRVAQAGKNVLYVAETGQLVSEEWKDHNSSVDLVIPTEAIKSVVSSRNTATLPTKVTVRGCYFSEYDQGDQDLTSAGSPGGGKPPGGDKKKGPVEKCIKNGLPADNVRALFRPPALKGGKKDWDNAEWDGGGMDIIAVDSSTEDTDRYGYEILLQETDGWVEEGDLSTQVSSTGRVRSDWEMIDHGDKNSRHTQSNLGRQIGQMPVALGCAPSSNTSGVSSGSGVGGVAYQLARGMPIERVENQIEVILEDPDLVDEFGIVYDEINNTYIPDKETCFDIAVRRFQEVKMERRAWELELSYLPTLSLNQVVTFTTPPLKDGSTQTVTGLITSVTVNFSPEPLVGQTCIVESFEDIGATDYVSSNLIYDPKMTSTDASGETHWSETEIGDGIALVGDVTYLRVEASGTAVLTLTQPGMESGGSYILEFELGKIEAGSADIEVEIVGVITQTYSTGGAKTIAFTATGASHIINWTAADTIGPSEWSVTKPSLSKSVMA